MFGGRIKKGINQLSLAFILVLVFNSCSVKETKNESPEPATGYSAKVEHAFKLDGFLIGELQSITEAKALQMGLVEIDRVVYSQDDENFGALYDMLDTMITYEGQFFDHPTILALHFKSNQLRFVVFSAQEDTYSDFFALFNQQYGSATQQGDTLSTGEAFQGDNTVWYVQDDEKVVGYVSLMPNYRQEEDAEDRSLKVTIFPFSAAADGR